MRPPSRLAWPVVLAAAQVHAGFLLGELSFGVGPRISPDGGQSIPGFSLQGLPSTPEVLSDKVILTPPAPGSQRGAVWADSRLAQSSWILDVDFRATGPDRGGGNLNIWLVRDGAQEVGTSSIYTVGRFDGLALVLDQTGGTGGMLRGFLNDGSTDYRSAQVDGLSFGHCNYAYRNRGLPSQIKLRQSPAAFRVEIDGNLCFESDQVSVPSGYQLGVTAASADNPDSFELYKTVVQVENPDSSPDQGQQQKLQMVPPSLLQASEQAPGRAIPDQSAQFADLNARLDGINSKLETLSVLGAGSSGGGMSDAQHAETSAALSELKGLLTKMDKLNDMEAKMRDIEKEVRMIRSDAATQVKNSESALREYLSNHHETLSQHVRDAAPGHAKLIFFIVGSQLLLVVAYVLYERRKASSSKKYL